MFLLVKLRTFWENCDIYYFYVLKNIILNKVQCYKIYISIS